MEIGELSQTTKSDRVFLIYAGDDKAVAEKIIEKFRQSGSAVTMNDFELDSEASLEFALKDAIVPYDNLFVLLSPDAVNSTWMRNELCGEYGTELKLRAIAVIPIAIAECQIPHPLSHYQILEVKTDLENRIDRLIEQIYRVTEIDFAQLDGKTFEKLIVDLLMLLGFEAIELERDNVGYDLKANYSHLDPFGIEVTETWAIAVKFYRESRAGLRTIRVLAEEYLSKMPIQSQGLIVTDDLLYSPTVDGLQSLESKYRIKIRAIDGMELKRLLLQHLQLVEKYFSRKYAVV